MNWTKRKIATLVAVILGAAWIWWLSTPHTYADCVLHYSKPNVDHWAIQNACGLKFDSPHEQDATSGLPRWLIVSSRPLTPIPSLLISYGGLLAYLRLAKSRKFTARDPIGAGFAYGTTEIVVYSLSVDDMHMLAATGFSVGLLVGLIWWWLTDVSHTGVRPFQRTGPQPNAPNPKLTPPIVERKFKQPESSFFDADLTDSSSPTPDSDSKKLNFAGLMAPGGILSLKGRVGLSAYWAWTLLAAAGPIAVTIAVPIGHLTANVDTFMWAMGIALLPFLWIAFATHVKRLHDRNLSGIWIILGLIPYVGWAGMVLACGLLPSDKGANRYGEPPSAQKKTGLLTHVLVVGVLFGIIGFCGFVASMFESKPMTSSSATNAGVSTKNLFDQFDHDRATPSFPATPPPPGFVLDKPSAHAPNALSPSPPLADYAASTATKLDAGSLYQLVSPSVVRVEAYERETEPNAIGSGVVVHKDAVATNCHVLKLGIRYRVLAGNVAYPAVQYYADKQHDVCALHVTNLPAPSVVLADDKGIKVGDPTYAIGNPEGLTETLSNGIVSNLLQIGDTTVIQTTAPISHGSSGGGLFDDRGRLVGLTTFIYKEGQNLNFAIPALWVKKIPIPSSVAFNDPQDMTIATPTATTDALRLVSLDMGNHVDSDQGVQTPINSFAPSDTFYASVRIKGKGTVHLHIQWMDQVGKTFYEQDKDVTSKKSYVCTFHLFKVGGWPEGTYQANVSMNGVSVAKKTFTVRSKGSSDHP